ncbi:MAG: guanine deaminase [Betaproteobacteria bacterium]|nr:guanine deaminase [Betaproteobacteria bacterium]
MSAQSKQQGGERIRAFRASILHFVDDPDDLGEGAHQYFEDGLLVLRDGRVAELGEAGALLARLPPDAAMIDYTGKLILPGFIDTHIHYPQTDIIASYGEQLLEWLERYTFPTERRFADPLHARAVADFFLEELLRNGTTTALVFATVHKESVDAIFEAAAARGMCLLAGKVMMDRNCPDFLRDTAESSYDDSKALIEKWHHRGRLRYAVTPRFAPTSTERQLELAGKLLDEHPDVYLQSHVAENKGEVAWVAELYPWSRSYLDVYDRFGLLRQRAVYAHCIHLDERDRERMAGTGTAMSFCPTSNLFLGSGLFDLSGARDKKVRVGIGTDVGGGTSFSMFRTLDEAYKVLQLSGQKLSAFKAFYLATLGSARALYLDGEIGNFAPGKEGDFVVLDPGATPLLARRMENTATVAERLFVLMMLADDRSVYATHIMGQPAYIRPAAPIA